MVCASILRHCTRTFVHGVLARALRDYLNPDVVRQGIAPTPAAVAERPLKAPWHRAAHCDSRLAGPATARLLVCSRASQHRCFSVAATGLHWTCILAFRVQRCCRCTWRRGTCPSNPCHLHTCPEKHSCLHDTNRVTKCGLQGKVVVSQGE